MEKYPQDLIEHNLPFVLLLGLESDAESETRAHSPPLTAPSSDSGFYIKARSPPITGRLADDLRTTLLSYDASDQPRSSLSSERSKPHIACKVKSVGRVGKRSAAPVRLCSTDQV